MKCQTCHGAGMAGYRANQFSIGDIEEVNLRVGAANCQLFTVRTESQRPDDIGRRTRSVRSRRRRSRDFEQLLAAGHFPNANDAVIAAGCQSLPLVAEREAQNPIRGAFETRAVLSAR